MFARGAAHLGRGLQPAAEGRALWLAEHLAAQFIVELHARHPCGLAVRHAGQARGDGWGDAASGARGAAVHRDRGKSYRSTVYPDVKDQAPGKYEDKLSAKIPSD